MSRQPLPVTFDELAAVSVTRRDRWHPPTSEPWSGADWSNAMCGEAGEAANVVKKLRRLETGVKVAESAEVEHLVGQLGDELADVLCYAVLLADHYGIHLGNAVVSKFNAVSRREGFPERLPEGSALPEVRCLDPKAHQPHEWSSLTHHWYCGGEA